MPPTTPTVTQRASGAQQIISDAEKVNRRIAALDTTIEELSSSSTKQAQTLPQSLVDDQRSVLEASLVNNDDDFTTAEGDTYRRWLNTAEGNEFVTEYRPEAEHCIEAIVALDNAWRMAVSQPIANRVGDLSPREQKALHTGEFYPRPDRPRKPKEPTPETERGPVPGAAARWVLSLLLAVAIPVIAGVVGWTNGSDTAEPQTLAQRGVNVIEGVPFDPAVFNSPLSEVVDEQSELSPAVEAQGPENAAELRDTASDQIRDEEESTALSYARNTAIISVVLAVALFIGMYAYSKSKRSNDIARRNANADLHWKARCDEIDRTNKSEEARWRQANDTKVGEIIELLSRRLGFDITDETIFRQWADYDYVDYAHQLREQLNNAPRSLPAKDNWLPLVTPTITERWFRTPMEIPSVRLKNIAESLHDEG